MPLALRDTNVPSSLRETRVDIKKLEKQELKIKVRMSMAEYLDPI
jgi:hypothetical protein